MTFDLWGQIWTLKPKQNFELLYFVNYSRYIYQYFNFLSNFHLRSYERLSFLLYKSPKSYLIMFQWHIRYSLRNKHRIEFLLFVEVGGWGGGAANLIWNLKGFWKYSQQSIQIFSPLFTKSFTNLLKNRINFGVSVNAM